MTSFYDFPSNEWGPPPPVGPVIAQILIIASLCGPFFVSQDSVLETGLRVIALYLFFEVTRRASDYLYRKIITNLSSVQTFGEGKPEFDWILAFVSEQTLFPRSFGADNIDKTEILPAGKPRSFLWGGTWIEVTRMDSEQLTYHPYKGRFAFQVKISSFKLSAMSAFLEEAKKRYMDVQSSDVIVHSVNNSSSSSCYSYSYSGNSYWGERKIRSTQTLALSLSDSEMDALAQESREFFDSSEWYAAAGVPWHKTYLLYGPEGTCPVNVVLALGAKLRREIFHLNLKASDTVYNNTSLIQAMAAVPTGSVLVIENIDQAYAMSHSWKFPPNNGSAFELRSSVTPLGLWETLNGHAREQGILVFGTASNATVGVIDEELCEAGIIEKKIECKYATKEQVVAVFNRFFPTSHGIPMSAARDSFSSDVKAGLLSDLAQVFAVQVPEDEFSIQDLQRYLVPHRTSPAAAVSGIKKWVDVKLDERAKRLYEGVRSTYRAPRHHRSRRNRSYTPSPGPYSPVPIPYAYPPVPPTIICQASNDNFINSVPGTPTPVNVLPDLTDMQPVIHIVVPSAPTTPLPPASSPCTEKMLSEDDLSRLSDLQRKVVECISSQPKQDEGIHFSVIVKALTAEDASLDPHKIDNVLDELLDEGYIYTTIDDAHFNVAI